jgi:hypothetical protein
MHKYSLKNQDWETRFAKKDLFIAASMPVFQGFGK